MTKLNPFVSFEENNDEISYTIRTITPFRAIILILVVLIVALTVATVFGILASQQWGSQYSFFGFIGGLILTFVLARFGLGHKFGPYLFIISKSQKVLKFFNVTVPLSNISGVFADAGDGSPYLELTTVDQKKIFLFEGVSPLQGKIFQTIGTTLWQEINKYK